LRRKRPPSFPERKSFIKLRADPRYRTYPPTKKSNCSGSSFAADRIYMRFPGRVPVAAPAMPSPARTSGSRIFVRNPGSSAENVRTENSNLWTSTRFTTTCLASMSLGYILYYRTAPVTSWRWILIRTTGEQTFVRWPRPVVVKVFLISLRCLDPVLAPIYGSSFRKPSRPGPQGLWDSRC